MHSTMDPLSLACPHTSQIPCVGQLLSQACSAALPGSQSGSTAYDVMIASCGVLSPASAPSQAATAALGRTGSRAAAAVPSHPQAFALESRLWGATQLRR